MSDSRAARRLGLLATTLTELLLMVFFVTLLLGVSEFSAQAAASRVREEQAVRIEQARERAEAGRRDAERRLLLVEAERDVARSDLEQMAADRSEDWSEDFTLLVRESVAARAEKGVVEAARDSQAQLVELRAQLAGREQDLRDERLRSRQLKDVLDRGMDAGASQRLETAVASAAEARRQLEATQVAARERESEVERQVRNARHQVEHLRRAAAGVGRGLDHPPCWFDAAGKIEYLLRVSVEERGLWVERAWPESRDPDAQALPAAATLAGRRWTAAEFERAASPLVAWSKRQQPECRHYVWLVDQATSKGSFKAGLLAVESAFYKYLER